MPGLWVRFYVGGCAIDKSSRGGNLGGKTNIIDENTKQTIKGILGSFTLIDWHWRWVKGPLEAGGVIH